MQTVHLLEKRLIHKALFQTVSLYCHMSIPPDTLAHYNIYNVRRISYIICLILRQVRNFVQFFFFFPHAEINIIDTVTNIIASTFFFIKHLLKTFIYLLTQIRVLSVLFVSDIFIRFLSSDGTVRLL